MGQITILTKEDDQHCHAVRLHLIECHLPFQEIVLLPSEPQPVPEIFFDNHPVPGGMDELLTILQKWEVVQGSNGQPTLVPIHSNNSSSSIGISSNSGSSNTRHLPDHHHHQQHQQQHQPYHDRWEDTPSGYNNIPGNGGYKGHRQRHSHHHNQHQLMHHMDSDGYREDPRYVPYARGGIQGHTGSHSHGHDILDTHSNATYIDRDYHSYRYPRDVEHQEYHQQQQDSQRQHQPQPRGYYETAFVPTANRRDSFQKSAYERHSFHGDELRRQAETEMMYHQPVNPRSMLDGGYQDDFRTHPPDGFSDKHSSVSPQRIPAYHEQGQHGGFAANPLIRSSFTDAALAATSPLPRNARLPNNSLGDSKNMRTNPPPPPPLPSLRGVTNTRRIDFQRSAYQRHSFHGTELLARGRHQERYQDDENPFVRRDASGHNRRDEDRTGGLEQSSVIHRHAFRESSRSFDTSLRSDGHHCGADMDYVDPALAENEDNMCSEHPRHSGNEEVHEEDSFSDPNDFGFSSKGGDPGAKESSNHDSVKFHSSQKSLSAKDLRDGHNPLTSPRIAGLNASRGSDTDSISPEDPEYQETSQRGDTDDSDRKKPTAVFSLANSPRVTLNRSFRQPSSKTLNARMQGVGRASSMRYSMPQSFVDTAEPPTCARADSHLPRKPVESKIATPRRSVSPVPSVRSNAARTRTVGLRKAALNISNRSLTKGGDDSSSSVWPSSTPISDDKRMVELPLGKFMSVLDATKELKRIMPSGNLKHKLTTYRNSFTGVTVADTLQEAYGLSRDEAITLGISLHHAKLLFHVCNDRGYEDTSKYFYRLQCQHTPEVLNSFCVWRDETTLTKSAEDVMGRALGTLLPLLAAVTDSTKGRVHYSRATKDHEDAVLELDFAICELQMVKLARLDKKSLLAFGLNAYQLFLHYAFIKVGIPGSSSAYTSFWTSLKFDIGGHLYSFSDWWNGICRGNKKGPYGPKPFQGKDWHIFLNLPDAVDPRIHFAAGMTHFMRPMFVYSGANIDLELEYVARSYCRNVEFVWMETTTNILTLTPYFLKYLTDFASTKHGLPKAIMPFMPGKEKAHIDEMLTVHKKIKVEFHDDVKNDGWNDYAGEHFVFESTPKADTKALVKKQHSDAPRKEVKRRGSFIALFRPEGAAAS